MIHRWTRADLRILADHDGVIVRGSVGVKIWPDGSLTRWEKRIPLELCNVMTVKQAVQVLGLQPHELGFTVHD